MLEDCFHVGRSGVAQVMEDQQVKSQNQIHACDCLVAVLLYQDSEAFPQVFDPFASDVKAPPHNIHCEEVMAIIF